MAKRTNSTKIKATNLTEIKEFFEKGDTGRKVALSELKELSATDKAELGALYAESRE